MGRFEIGLRVVVGAVVILAASAGACGGDGTTGTSSSSTSSSSSGTGADPCASIVGCDDCVLSQGCGFCYQTGKCAAGGDSGPSSGMCASWQPYEGFPSCFSPILCDPQPPAASGSPCGGSQGCYVVSSTEGTRCLPAGAKAPGDSCSIGDVTDICQPGFLCDLMGSTGVCHQVCTMGDDSTCPAGGHCALYLGILHGPYGVCR
jgi:hypothetical protein